MNDQSAKKLCFVIGPIGAEDSKERIHSEWVLAYIIRPVMDGFPSYHVKRADEDPRPGLIDAQLIKDLLDADLVIADLSFNNPNAFYEIGIRHMAQKPIIHIQIEDDKIPFDLSLYRSIKFCLAMPTDIDKAQAKLKRQVEAIQADGYQVENPVTKTRGVVQFQEHATPSEKVLLEQIENLNRRLSNIEQSPFGPNLGSTSPPPTVGVFNTDMAQQLYKFISREAHDPSTFRIVLDFKPDVPDKAMVELVDLLRSMTIHARILSNTSVEIFAPVRNRETVNRVINIYRQYIKE